MLLVCLFYSGVVEGMVLREILRRVDRSMPHETNLNSFGITDRDASFPFPPFPSEGVFSCFGVLSKHRKKGDNGVMKSFFVLVRWEGDSGPEENLLLVSAVDQDAALRLASRVGSEAEAFLFEPVAVMVVEEGEE